MSSNIRDLQIIIATRLYNENPNITSRKMAKSLPNSSGGYGIRLQSAQQIIREIKNVPVNPKMVKNPFGQKGKPIIIEDKTNVPGKNRKIIADTFKKSKSEKSHRRYKYYFVIESLEAFYPSYEPITYYINYGFNNINEYYAIKDRVTVEYARWLNNGEMTYKITDGYDEIAEYEIR